MPSQLSPMTSIKKLLETTQTYVPRGHLLAAIGLLTGVLTVVNFPSNDTPDTPQTQVSLAIPDPAPQTAAITPDTEFQASSGASAQDAEQQIQDEEPPAKEFTVQTGDNLSLIFKRAGLNDRDIYELFDEAPDAKALRNIRPGQKLSFLTEGNQLQELTYSISLLDSLTFTRTDKGFVSNDTSVTPDVKYAFAQGVIDSSLYLAGKRAGLSSGITMELANIFGWDVDFALDIQKGDSFKVMYEEQHLNGKRVGTGKIIAAEFVNDGKTYKAVRYTNKDGVSRYYTPDGRGMQKAFLRTPIEFARISSGFTLARMHPVLHIMRAHKGTDYAASRGTPIRATGDGKIAFAGRRGGYGNCIVINHGSGYETLYGHMNNFAKGIKAGVRINQGDVIGYVGSTGLASGPHLHYEFHINGQVRNPVTVPLPQAMGIDKSQLAQFNQTTHPLIAQLDQYSDASHLAMAKGTSTSN